MHFCTLGRKWSSNTSFSLSCFLYPPLWWRRYIKQEALIRWQGVSLIHVVARTRCIYVFILPVSRLIRCIMLRHPENLYSFGHAPARRKREGRRERPLRSWMRRCRRNKDDRKVYRQLGRKGESKKMISLLEIAYYHATLTTSAVYSMLTVCAAFVWTFLCSV